MRGRNFGEGLHDLVQLECGGVDVLGTATYVSPVLVKFVSIDPAQLAAQAPGGGQVQLCTRLGTARSSTKYTLAEGVGEGASAPAAAAAGGGGRAGRVLRLSPRCGSGEGGDTLTIEGANLGLDRDDVLGVLVAGVPVSTITWVSPEKLEATTAAGAGLGAVTVITRSGGVGASDPDACFTFAPAATVANVVRLTETLCAVQAQNRALQDKNQRLQEYTDRILAELLQLDSTGTCLERIGSSR